MGSFSLFSSSQSLSSSLELTGASGVRKDVDRSLSLAVECSRGGGGRVFCLAESSLTFVSTTQSLSLSLSLLIIYYIELNKKSATRGWLSLSFFPSLSINLLAYVSANERINISQTIGIPGHILVFIPHLSPLHHLLPGHRVWIYAVSRVRVAFPEEPDAHNMHGVLDIPENLGIPVVGLCLGSERLQNMGEAMILNIVSKLLLTQVPGHRGKEVGELNLELEMLPLGIFQKAGESAVKRNSTHQEVIGCLNCKQPALPRQFHRGVEQCLLHPALSYPGRQLSGEVLAAGQRDEELEGHEKQFFVGILDVIEEGKEDLVILEDLGYSEAFVACAAALQGLQDIFKVALGFAVGGFVQKVVDHFLRQVAGLAEDIDQPGPVLALTDLPFSAIQVLGQQATVDYQVAEVDDGVVAIFVDVADESLDVLLPEEAGVKAGDGFELLLFEVADSLIPDLEHDAGDLAAPGFLPELCQLPAGVSLHYRALYYNYQRTSFNFHYPPFLKATSHLGRSKPRDSLRFSWGSGSSFLCTSKAKGMICSMSFGSKLLGSWQQSLI